MAAFRIAVIGGDGIGPEVIAQAVRVAEQAGRRDRADLHWNHLPWSSAYNKANGRIPPAELALQTAVFTRRGCERAMRAAFAAARHRRKKVTSITKSNALIYGLALWDECFKTVAAEFPDVQAESLLVDAAAMDLVRRPERFDVITASNLFGDILTDLAAAVTGSIGLASSANINPERVVPSMFE